MHKTYHILIEDGILILANTKTDSEGGRFETKIEAFKQLVEMTIDNHISGTHGKKLFVDILKTNIQFDVIDFNQHPHKIFKSQIGHLLHTNMLYQMLEEIHNTESVSEPCLKICKECNDHGTIYLPHRKSVPIYSKKQGFLIIESFHQEGLINLGEKKALIQAIKDSTIPHHRIETLCQA